MDGEIRQNKATKEWVIMAPAGDRPHDFRRAERERPPLPSYDPTCPFCPGNEHRLLSVLEESPGGWACPWQTRVVPNRYPALTPGGSTSRQSWGIYVSMQGHGHHEVIIESPRHDDDIIRMSLVDVAALIETYHQRFVHWIQDERNVLILIFRNHGPRARRLADPPPLATDHDRHGPAPRPLARAGGPALLRRMGSLPLLRHPRLRKHRDRRRVILENPSFLAFIPFAADVPFETWIMPKRHQPDFGQITTVEKDDLAQALHVLLARARQEAARPRL